MTTTTAPLAPTRSGPDRRAALTFPRIVTSEWIKFRSVRSTAWTLPITALTMAGLSALQAWAMTQFEGGETMGLVSAAPIITGGWFLAQLVVAVLAILTITGEYTTGMIRSTLAAVPTRLPALWAKALVLSVVVALVSLVAVALSYLAALPFLGTLGLGLDLGDPDVLRVVLGAPLYLTTIALFAFAVGTLMRHSAGAIAVVLGFLLVIENVLGGIPWRPLEVIAPFLPSRAGARLLTEQATLDMMDQGSTVATLTAWQGYGVLAAWTLLLLAAAAFLLRRRDA
jgi:ABC-2 type transport system permease protein